MPNAERIDAGRARERVETGNALLVCAYDDEGKCRDLEVEDAITLAELRSRDVANEREIVFFCA